jgi:hypothetical protein
MQAELDALYRQCIDGLVSSAEMRSRLTLIYDEYLPGWETRTPELLDGWAETTKSYDELAGARRAQRQAELDALAVIEEFRDDSSHPPSLEP